MNDENKAFALLEAIIHAQNDKALKSQLDTVHLQRDTDAPMIFDIEVGKTANLTSLPNGSIPMEGRYDDGLVLVFVKNGVLSWIEAPWFSKVMPKAWPALEDVKIAIPDYPS